MIGLPGFILAFLWMKRRLLAQEHPIKAELVKLRYFAGLTNQEAAQVLGISLTTVKDY